ncbi:MAG: NAD-dependent protein deacylase [Thermoflavifilum sp.]|nr:NAD-dependent protein deacylase [Thermoflavifilum sp.]MCL6514042.1 NAD-dependent protein deacylase [Alicyclobacillus sp.]
MTWSTEIEELARLLQNSGRIMVLTGAGMSTESGIPDFRSENGVWQDHTLLEAMSDEYLRRYPEAFWPRFKSVFLRPEYVQAEPNMGHLALAALEQLGKPVSIYTQNVDGLHQKAGSRRVFEVHGSAKRAYCPVCGAVYGLDHVLREDVPRCHAFTMKGGDCDHILYPDTVLFGQPVRHYERALLAARECDLLLVIGSSLTVEPVASLPGWIDRQRTRLAIINLDETPYDDVADLVIHAKVGEVLPRAVFSAA